MANKRNTSTKGKKTAKKPSRARSARQPGVLSDPRAMRWEKLLRDPCAAELASPCYGGADSGYLIRTVDNYSLTGAATTGTPGTATTADVLFQYTPFNLATATGIVIAAIQGGGTMPAVSATGLTNFVVSSVVKRYRPVAACLKFVPTGPYGNRQGLVASGYSPGQVLTSGQTTGINALVSECQRTSNNGSEQHEVRWLPTSVDENFTDVGTANNTGAGTMYFALRGVDANYTTATTMNVNGYVEITSVWEWVPAAANSIAVSPKAPLPFTSQSVLSTIGDMGAFLFHGMRGQGPGLMRAAAQEGMRLMTSGYGGSRTRAAAFQTLTY